MQILWWHWLVLGLLLVVAEMASAGGFYIIFFGIGALVVGVLAVAGVTASTPIELLLFAVVSVASLATFRSRLVRRLDRVPQPGEVDSLVGGIGIVAHDLAPDEVGRVELRGAAWSARNASTTVLPAGSRCRVVRVDGLMLHVAPEEGR